MVLRREARFSMRGSRLPMPLAKARSKRSIQEDLLDPLATQLLDGKFKPGDRIKATAQDGELVFEKA